MCVLHASLTFECLMPPNEPIHTSLSTLPRVSNGKLLVATIPTASTATYITPAATALTDRSRIDTNGVIAPAALENALVTPLAVDLTLVGKASGVYSTTIAKNTAHVSLARNIAGTRTTIGIYSCAASTASVSAPKMVHNRMPSLLPCEALILCAM